MRRSRCFRVGAGIFMLTITLLLGSSAWAAEYKTICRFSSTVSIHGDGYPHAQGLLIDSAGNLYGKTETGGVYGYGTVYEVSPNGDGTWTGRTLHSFTGTDGNNPRGKLTFDAAGNLYGTTQFGGDAGWGTVFEMTPNGDGSWTEKVLHSFVNGDDGANVDGGVAFDGAGNLYGTSEWGGGGMGSVFELSPNSDGTWTEQIICGFEFDGSNGAYPWSVTPVFDSAGNIYGTGAYGGRSGCSPRGNGCYGLGVLFELSPNAAGGWTQKVLYEFTDGLDGATPTGPVVFDNAGNFYGTSYWGGRFNGNGNIFKATHNPDGSWSGQILHEFTGGNDGAMPFCCLSFDNAGNLYGTAQTGGAFGYGTLFRLTPTAEGGWNFTVLYSFNDNPGAYPEAGVIFDSAGNLYGTTDGDGTTTFGTVYEITQP
jgi:uncharacterized repeat protein (TIGR03803 family)